MGSIPLPALSVEPYRQQDLAGQFQRVMQLRQLLQAAPLHQQLLQQQVQAGQQQLQAGQLENQQRQISIQSQQALMKAYQEADGDLSKAVPLAGKYGASPADVMKLHEASIQQQQQNLALFKSKRELALQDADLMQKSWEDVDAASADNRPIIYGQKLQALQRAGVDVSQVPPQYPGDEQFALMGTAIKGHKAQMADLAQQLGLQKTGEEIKKLQMEQAMGGSANDTSRFINNYLQANNLPNTPENQLKAFDVYTQKTKIAPAQVRAQFLLMRPTEVLDPNNPGQTLMVPGSKSYGMAGKSSVSQKALSFQAAKAQPQFVAFDTADQHLQLIEQAGAALQNGDVQGLNQIANWYGVQVGKDPVTTFKALTTVAAPEIVRASAGSGQMSEREIEVARNNFDPKLSPQQITSNVKAMRGLMAGKKAALQKNLTGLQSGDIKGGGAGFGQQGGGAAAGYVRIQASDGSVHDIPQQNLGAARQRDPGLKVMQ